jgi:hypothetical protein
MRPALWRPAAPGAVARAVGETVAALPRGTWLHYAFNAEYLIFPFCETRRIGDLLAFHAEERRAAMPTWVVDLYAPDLATHPDGVDRDGAHLDARGYYALARTDPATGRPADRQLDLYGGLRWRFEEHVPPHRRRIDRIGLVRARPGLRLGDDNLWSEPELNTHACPWHANATAAVCSFRAAKALRANPASRRAIDSFLWPGAVPFRWQSRQLLDLGLIEPGQWF